MASDFLTVIVASGTSPPVYVLYYVMRVSCVAFCIVILMLVVVLYRKDPLCCRFRPYTTEYYTDEAPHYHTRHTLMGLDESSAAFSQGAARMQVPGRLFIVGKPNDYHMEGPLPRLPSYESVRKKDRQRQIHSLIAQRFGLSSCHDEPPPTYDETLRHSLDVSSVSLRSLDVHLSTHSQDESSQLSEDTHNLSQPTTALEGLAPSYCPAQNSSFLSL